VDNDRNMEDILDGTEKLVMKAPEIDEIKEDKK
jgi:hypothetical protein